MKHAQDQSRHGDRASRDSASTSRLVLRVRVRVRRARLDRQLADGLAPEALLDRAVRAGQLVDPATRRRTARTLRRLVMEAELPAAARACPVVPVHRRSVLPWREALLGLADRLENSAPLNPCGIARTLVLLTDGAGPLYDPRSAFALGDAVWWVADGLQLSHPADE